METISLSEITDYLGVTDVTMIRKFREVGVKSVSGKLSNKDEEPSYLKSEAQPVVDEMAKTKPKIILRVNRNNIDRDLKRMSVKDVAEKYGFTKTEQLRRALHNKGYGVEAKKPKYKGVKRPNNFGKGLYYTAFNALNIAARVRR